MNLFLSMFGLSAFKYEGKMLLCGTPSIESISKTFKAAATTLALINREKKRLHAFT